MSANRIAIAQLSPFVGNFEYNVKEIQKAYEQACHERACLVLTPELSVLGYPAYDLLDRSDILVENQKALDVLARITTGKQTALVVGAVRENKTQRGKKLYNSAVVLFEGKIIFEQAKSLLPTYDVFDEARYFEPASEIKLWEFQGVNYAIAICEDLWAEDSEIGKPTYASNPVEKYLQLKPDCVLSIAASPYSLKKSIRREKIHKEVAERVNASLLYVNQTGATDDVLFDGQSFFIQPNAQGKTQLSRLSAFKKELCVFDLSEKNELFKSEQVGHEEMDILFRGLVLGIQEYFAKTGFSKAVLGLSGGIDSAVVAVLACEALGSSNVLGIAMPSQYSSSHSLEDAEDLAQRLEMRFEIQPIKFLNSTATRQLSEVRGELLSVASENMQSRLRGLIVMTLSNHENALALGTSNKSELATGYGTLYGDMVGALAPIGDLVKTKVYELARYINQNAKIRGKTAPIPERTISKAPSAELKPNQVDQDTLPPYDFLDAYIQEVIEEHRNSTDILEDWCQSLKARWPSYSLQEVEKWIGQVERLLQISEFKRRQYMPILRVTKKSFGIGRRVPVAKKWQSIS